jgi:anti-anti-sigma factor
MVPDASSQLPAEPLVIPEIVSFPVEVDISNSDEVSAALSAAIRPGVLIVIADLSRTTFCDGAGIRCLLAAHHQAVECGVELRAVIRSSAVWRLLVLLGGDEELHVYSNMKGGLTGGPGAARRSRADDPARAVADVFRPSHNALRAACDSAERLAAP